MQQKVIVTEVYSRVVGYYRPVHQWNAGKQNEFADRKEWSVPATFKSVNIKKD